MDRQNVHPDAEKALTKAWYAAMLDLYSTVLMDPSTADRNRACEIILDYSIRLGQSLNDTFIPATGDVEDKEDEEDDND